MDIDAYLVLGVGRDASASEIRAAYRRSARIHHPDQVRGDAAVMAQVNAAWRVLGDPARRAAYDASTGAVEGVPRHVGLGTDRRDPPDGSPSPATLRLLVLFALGVAIVLFVAILLIGFGRVGTTAPP